VNVFRSYEFKDACFPSNCEDRIKFKASSSDVKLPVVQIIF